MVESSDFKRGRVPSYVYLVVSLLLGTLLEIVESLLKKDTFNLSSPVADVCTKAAPRVRLHDWLKVEENKAVAEEFSALRIQLELVADRLNTSKKISAGREMHVDSVSQVKNVSRLSKQVGRFI